MKAIIKYQINEITENTGWHNGMAMPQKVAKMNVVALTDPNDPNYIYGQISGGSTQTLSTTNRAVYNEWYIGAIITCEMTAEPAKATA